MTKVNDEHKNFLAQLFYWSCVIVILTFASHSIIRLYKVYYIVTSCSCLIAVFAIFCNKLKIGKLIPNILGISIYFLYLLSTSLWSSYPENTIMYVLIDSIGIAIFSLFYILSTNFSPEKITDFFVNLTIPFIVIVLITYIIEPDASRVGGYALTICPFIFFFCLLRLIHSFSMRIMFFSLSCLLMLLIGMSRSPLLIAGMGLVFTFFTLCKSWGTRFKLLTASTLIGIAMTITVFNIAPLKMAVAKTIVRITYQDMIVDGTYLEAEQPDELRKTVNRDAKDLYPENWLLGIGYMNFQLWFADEHNYHYQMTARGDAVSGVNLHNVFQTWSLEGGIPCLIICFIFLWRYFRILIKSKRYSKNDFYTSYYNILAISMVCLLIYGLFHQIHQNPVFFALLGIVFALNDKYSCKKT